MSDYFDIDGILRPAVFPNPYTRMLQVDTGGRANYTTITAAINAAVAAGAADATPWVILVNQGTYAEDVTVPTGVSLVGQGWSCVQIVPQTEPVIVYGANSRTQFSGIEILPASNTLLCGLKLVITASGHRIDLQGVRVQVVYPTNDSVDAVQITGSNGSGFIVAQNCYFYAQNHYTGSVTYSTVDGAQVASAKATVFRIPSGQKPYIEVDGCHAKTSVGSTGTGDSVLVWNQGDGAYAGVHGVLSWAAVWAERPIVLLNQNATYRGGMLDVAITTSDTEGDAVMLNAEPDGPWALCSRLLNKLRLYGDIRFHTAPGFADYRTYVAYHPTDELDRIHYITSYNLLLDQDTGEFTKQVEGKAGFHAGYESEWEDTIEFNVDHTLRDDTIIRRVHGMRIHVDTGIAQWSWVTDHDNEHGFDLGGTEPGLAIWRGDSNTSPPKLYAQNVHPGGTVIMGLTGEGGTFRGGFQYANDEAGGTFAGVALADLFLMYAERRMMIGTVPSQPVDFVTNSTHRGGIKADGTWFQTHGGVEYTIPHDAMPGFAISPMISGQYYAPVGASIGTATALTADTMRAAPIILTRNATIDRIGIRVGTGVASTTVRLGIYADDGTGRPSTLVADFGTVDTSTTGNKELTVSQALTRGRWWLVAAAKGGNPVFNTVLGGGWGVPQAYADSTSRVGWSSTHSGSTLDSTFGSPATEREVPRILYRVSL